MQLSPHDTNPVLIVRQVGHYHPMFIVSSVIRNARQNFAI